MTRRTSRCARLLPAGAVALGGLLAVSTITAAPAGAAVGWVPADHALGNPLPAYDAEISVTAVTGGQGSLAAFDAQGAAVEYGTTFKNLQDYQWSPAGDVLAYGPAKVADPPSEVGSDATKGAPLTVVAAKGQMQWSPYGDSMTGSRPATSSAPGPYALWVSNGGSRAFTHPAVKGDVGVPAVAPSGVGIVYDAPSTSTEGKRDLWRQDQSFPMVSNPGWYPTPTAPVQLGYSALDAHDPVISAAGVLAFVGADGDGSAVYVDEGKGPTKVAPLGASCPGQRPAFAPSGTAIAYLRAVGTSCETTELHTLTRAGTTFVGGTDKLLHTSATGTTYQGPSWRAHTPDARRERLFGKDRIETGIAISKRFRGAQQASVVVLANSLNFADAVSGGPLSAQADGPLLLNPQKTLHPGVRAEIKRVLAKDGWVYAVGGTASLSDQVLRTLTADGIQVVRLAGKDRFATSVAVAQELDAGYKPEFKRTHAFLADGMAFPDALVAGPAATHFFAPVLLSAGAKLPPVVKSYLAAQKAKTTVYGIGGNAAKAAATLGSARARSVVGKDRYDTSAQVARAFYPGQWAYALASGKEFADALTGGASMGATDNPILLTSSGSTLPASVGQWGRDTTSATDIVLAFGGPTAVSDSALNTAQQLAGRQTPAWGPDVSGVGVSAPLAGQAPFTALQRDRARMLTHQAPSGR